MIPLAVAITRTPTYLVVTFLVLTPLAIQSLVVFQFSFFSLQIVTGTSAIGRKSATGVIADGAASGFVCGLGQSCLSERVT